MFMALTRISVLSDCSGNGRALNFACRTDEKKAKNVGQTKAVK